MPSTVVPAVPPPPQAWVLPLAARLLGVEGLLVLLGQLPARLPHPGPDGVGVTVPLPGQVGGRDLLLAALRHYLGPLLRGQQLGGKASVGTGEGPRFSGAP